MGAPNTTLYVCAGVRLDPRYDHTIYFPTDVNQRAYFSTKVKRTFTALSYIRKTWPVQLPATMEEAKTWNYLFFQNGSGKYYYYFITNVEYKNEAMVELTLELDVLQTYLFDFEPLQCFVERQHSETDSPGDNTVDEGLELGELVDNSEKDWEALKTLCILVLATCNPNYTDTTSPVDALPMMYDGVFSGIKLFAVDPTDWSDWGQKLDALDKAGFADGIVNMWMYPKALVSLGGEDTWTSENVAHVVGSGASISALTLDPTPGNVNGYTPKNKKLLSYPFNFLYVTNNNGGSAVYRYERFMDGEPAFHCNGTLAPDASVKMYPANRYNDIPLTTGASGNQGANYEQGLSMGGYPACAWDSDIYKMWLAQNQNQHALAFATGAGMIFAGGATAILSGGVGAMAGAGMALSGAQQIAQLMAQQKDMSIQPDQARGSFSSSVNVSAGKHTFTFIRKSVDAEHARMLDDYFTMYGYKQNRLMVPNIKARKAFTYVKTVGCKISGNMCADDITKIEAIFDRGITWWRAGDNVGDYSQDNTV